MQHSIEYPTQIQSGQYATFRDDDGNQLIDLSGGFGYQVPEVIDAVIAQSDKMALSNRVLISAPLIQLCQKIASILPKPLEMSYVCNSGDEAFEGALKLAKGLNPKAKYLVYVTGGDYGSLTYGRCMTTPERYQEVIEFLGIQLVAISYIDDIYKFNKWNQCLAVCHTGVIRNRHGALTPINQSLLDHLYNNAKQHKVPVISVDVQTGLGQMGTLFAHEYYQLTPDIVVLGNNLAGGAVPIGTYTSSALLANKVYGKSSPAKHGSTTAGNPLSCVAALAAIDLAVEQRLFERVSHYGQLFKQKIKKYQVVNYGGIVNIMLPNDMTASQLRQDLYQHGVYVSPRQVEHVLTLICPLTARPEEMVNAIELINKVIKHVDQTV